VRRINSATSTPSAIGAKLFHLKCTFHFSLTCRADQALIISAAETALTRLQSFVDFSPAVTINSDAGNWLFDAIANRDVEMKMSVARRAHFHYAALRFIISLVAVIGL